MDPIDSLPFPSSLSLHPSMYLPVHGHATFLHPPRPKTGRTPQETAISAEDRGPLNGGYSITIYGDDQLRRGSDTVVVSHNHNLVVLYLNQPCLPLPRHRPQMRRSKLPYPGPIPPIQTTRRRQ